VTIEKRETTYKLGQQNTVITLKIPPVGRQLELHTLSASGLQQKDQANAVYNARNMRSPARVACDRTTPEHETATWFFVSSCNTGVSCVSQQKHDSL